jgi:hypothetical protein
VCGSFLEIYNEEIRDLLGSDPKAKCELKEDPSKGVYVKGLTDEVVQDESHMNQIMDKGSANRTVGATAMNAVRPPPRPRLIPEWLLRLSCWPLM